MRTRQVVLGFQKPIDTKILIQVLQKMYGKDSVTVGHGSAINGIPNDWIVVNNERQ